MFDLLGRLDYKFHRRVCTLSPDLQLHDAYRSY